MNAFLNIRHRLLAVIMMLSLCVGTAFSASYDKLWSDYKKADEAQKPKTAIVLLREIEQKSLRDERYGDYLAASFADILQSKYINTDSACNVIRRVIKWQKAVSNDYSKRESHSKNEIRQYVAAAISRFLIYRYYDHYVSGYGFEEEIKELYSKESIESMVDSLLADKAVVDVMAEENQALAYLPLVKKGDDSKIFRHDLLSILCFEVRRYDFLSNYYLQRKDSVAACLAAADDIYYVRKKADSLIAIYGNLQECGEIAYKKVFYMRGLEHVKVRDMIGFIDSSLVRWPKCRVAEKLRSMRRDATYPVMDVELRKRQITPNKEQMVYFDRVRNMSQAVITVTPLTGEDMCELFRLEDEARDKYVDKHLDRSNQKVFKHFFDLYDTPSEFEYRTDSIAIGKFPVGVYLVEVTPKWSPRADFVTEMKSERRLMFVSDLTFMAVPLPQKRTRIVVVNATTGLPVAGAAVKITDRDGKTVKQYTADENGECLVSNLAEDLYIAPSTPNDKASWYAYTDNGAHFPKSKDKNRVVEKKVQLFTDRAIYRPGQKVEVSAVMYMEDNCEGRAVAPNEKLTLKFKESYGKEIASKTLTTDEFGCAATAFDIPKEGRNGYYEVECGFGSVEIRVEEYVRPTFEVNISKPETAYNLGDTLSVYGKVAAYSGAAMAGSRVSYTIKRCSPLWAFPREYEIINNGKVTVSDDGSFVMKAPMVMPKDDKPSRFGCRYYRIKAEAHVVSPTGESQSGSITIPLTDRTTFLVGNFAKQFRPEVGIKTTIYRYNSLEKQIPGRVNLLIDDIPTLWVDANKEFLIPTDITSGKHSFTAICETDTLRGEFVTFSLNDKKPPYRTPCWFYCSDETFPADGGKVAVQFGSSEENVHVVYAIASGDQLLESGTERLSASNITRFFTYKPEYGDGITLTYAWTKNGITCKNTISIAKPAPPTRLNIAWKTFRNKLLPGQKEEWRLHVSDEKGRSSKASLVATMFDSSLDAIRKHRWNMSFSRNIALPSFNWRSPSCGSLKMYLHAKYKSSHVKSLEFSSFEVEQEKIFDCIETRSPNAIGTKRLIGDEETGVVLMAKSMTNTRALVGSIGGNPVKEAKKGGLGEDESTASIDVRKDFSETAFFLPALRTDANGEASLSFTLPESVTTWTVMAFAHDKEMKNGILTDKVVAQKQLMVQPRLPRFLRVGDKATLAAMVSNLSEKEQNVTVRIELLDAKTEQKQWSSTEKVVIKAGESKAVTFPLERYPDCDFICRVTALGNGFSDGEQSLLPVLSDEELVTRTVAYAFADSTPSEINLTDMVKGNHGDTSVKVEYTANPEYLLLEALPELAKPDCDNAICLSSALYASVVAAHIKDTVPSFDTQNIIGKLSMLQLSDGSFAWWKGMEGSYYMTMAVAETLARMEMLAGKQSGVEAMMRKAMAYLDASVAKDVAEMRKTEKQHTPYVSRFHLSYLYAAAIYNKVYGINTVSSDKKYLLSLLPKATQKADMTSKSMAAIVFHLYGNDKLSKQYAESILEHTVFRSDVGRYFDSYRAPYSWCDYRIPTQSMAIEALNATSPQSRQEIADMKRWLLSSKRTQQWDTPYNTVNAVHAFFGGMASADLRIKGKGKSVVCDTLIARKAMDDNADFVVRLPKKDGGESWASAFISYKEKSSNIKAASSGIAVEREILSKEPLKVGDKVRVGITIVADRDYDFVSVTDNRAACFEPVNQLSGYRNGAYQEMKDKKSVFHFNRLRKGTHVIETEYYVERKGTYSSGSVTAVCSYAPEFSGTGKSYEITVE